MSTPRQNDRPCLDEAAAKDLEDASTMTREELISRLHSVGHLYWRRPETADCLIKVVRLSASQHDGRSMNRQPQRHCRQCLCSSMGHHNARTDQPHGVAPAPSELLSAPGSAPPAISRFSRKDTMDKYRSNQSYLGLPSSIIDSKSKDDSSEDHLKRWPKSAAGSSTEPGLGDQDSKRHNSTESSTRPGSYDGHIYRASASMPLLPVRETPSPRRNPMPQHVSIGDVRRDSAPPSMNGATAVAAAPTRRCTRCDSHAGAPDQGAKTFRLHRDFLITQSDTFKKLLGDAMKNGYSKAGSASTSQQSEGEQAGLTDGSQQSSTTLTGRQSPSAHRHGSDDDTSAVSQTCLELALPDPASFEALIEYFYIGDFGKLAAAMESGAMRWENVMLNAQHLGLSQGLKMRLGAWWRYRQGQPLGSLHQHVQLTSQRQDHRGSLPPRSLTPDSRTRLEGGRSERVSRLVGTRPRAYTTGSRQSAGLSDEAMTPSRAFAGLPSGLARVAAQERPGHGNKRARDAECQEFDSRAIRTESQHNLVRLSRQLARSSGQPTADRSDSMSMPLATTRRTSSTPSSPRLPRFPHHERRPDLRISARDEDRSVDARTNIDIHEERAAAPRPSAVRQLLMGGKRRRALSSLAYYCSTGPTTNSGRLAPVEP